MTSAFTRWIPSVLPDRSDVAIVDTPGTSYSSNSRRRLPTGVELHRLGRLGVLVVFVVIL